MASDSARKPGDAALRARALSRLTSSGTPPIGRLDSAAAFQALYDLALSPETAPRALALLHELQVHQVELELQDEELRRSRSELEATVFRHAQLYDGAPVGLYTVNPQSILVELNAIGALMLGSERDALIGRPLDSFLAADGAAALRSMCARVRDGGAAGSRVLQLALPDGTSRAVRASASRDPAGVNVFIALVGADGAAD
jgi:PAS domain-containing protein